MNKTSWRYVRLFFLIGIPIALLVLPKEFFDNGPDTCPSRIFFQTDCPGCGMTRACMYLIHFDFGGAYYLNAASFAVFPVLAFTWGRWLWQDAVVR